MRTGTTLRSGRIRAIALLVAATGGAVVADSTIDPTNRAAYAANLGWLNAHADGTNGAVLGRSYCAGHVWSANAGWIALGHGPTNGWRYGNASAGDWGVNHDGEGRLEGRAYGANIGWMVFEQTHGQPRVDLRTGDLTGFAWSANAGWIALDTVHGFLRTARLDPGPDTDGDDIPDAWEYQRTGSLTNLQGGVSDADLDGVPDAAEYLTDTDPLNPGERLQIVSLTTSGGWDTLSWSARPTRLYRVESTNALPVITAGPWPDAGYGLLGPEPGTPMELELATGIAPQFYRVIAVLPLE